MHYTEVRQVAARREDVWLALHDSEGLRASIPGCEQLIRLGDDEYAAVLATREDTCRGLLTVADVSPGSDLTLTLAGRGQCSTLEVRLDIRLRAGRVPGTTSLVHGARVHFGGPASALARMRTAD